MVEDKKKYKISYKTYFNDRLKEVHFHGVYTYPLYIQVTFERKSIFFKSYYFELFSRARYLVTAANIKKGPSVKDIADKEMELIGALVKKHENDFSLDVFKKEYNFYSTDLLDISEAGFTEYIAIFFQDEGMPSLGSTLYLGVKYNRVTDLLRDIKRAFDKKLYDKFLENSRYYAPPYLHLYGFAKQRKSKLTCLSVMEWEKEETKTTFDSYLDAYHKDEHKGIIYDGVKRLINQLAQRENG
ncbi:hypothetical protein [Mucilaginibacter defluvii]|uniref:Uncharacterized protein n=1 Tax=Mucilaginibacter defluvii TaxID=1196019 RepID=A0ABP9G6D2_9SPHI